MDFSEWTKKPTNPMETITPDDPNSFWVGHYALVPGCRIVFFYKDIQKVFIYVSLSDAIRHEISTPDNRNLELVFHPDTIHDDRLKKNRIRQERILKKHLTYWDKRPDIQEEEI